MSTCSQFAKLVLSLIMLSAMTHPAQASVKAGVDAWARGDFDTAVKQWRDAALNGDPDAQFNMGQAYKMGRGVATDLTVALDWYKKAASQGHLQASDSYGHLLHYQGKIVEALPILQTSAARGDPRAQYLLGTELFNGVHIEKDWVRAYALMTRASSAGMGPASRSLAQMDQYVSAEQRQQAIALAGELEPGSGEMRAVQVTGIAVNAPVPPSKIQPLAAAPVQPLDNTPAKAALVETVPVKPAKVDGKWRIQLGAFGDESNARKLWTTLGSKFSDLAGLQLYLKPAGALTRLQAGPFASSSAAEALCGKLKAAGQACISVEG